jgi:CRP-like cAMP-binding protein
LVLLWPILFSSSNIFSMAVRMTSARERAASTFLVSNGWLATCEPAFRDWIGTTLRWKAYPAGTGITHAGDDTGGIYCVGDGQVNFDAKVGVDDIGTSYMALPGMWWGYAPLFGSGRFGSGTAAIDSMCGAVPVSLLKARLLACPDEWRSVALGLSALWAQAAGAHADLLIPESDRRIAATILRLGGHRHHVFTPELPKSFTCTQEQMAGATGLSRNTTGKVLRTFQKYGLLDARYGSISILDRKGLTAIVAG